MGTGRVRAATWLLAALTLLLLVCFKCATGQSAGTTLAPVDYTKPDVFLQDYVFRTSISIIPTTVYLPVVNHVSISSAPGEYYTLYWGPTRTSLTLMPG